MQRVILHFKSVGFYNTLLASVCMSVACLDSGLDFVSGSLVGKRLICFLTRNEGESQH